MAVPMTSAEAQAILAVIGAFGTIFPGVWLMGERDPKIRKICITLLIICGVFIAPGLGRLWTIALLGG